MGSEGRRTVRSPQVEYRCPACGQPVGTVIKRHKTLGAFVPRWEPGPCRNEECAEYSGERDGHPEEEPRAAVATSPEPGSGTDSGTGAGPATS